MTCRSMAGKWDCTSKILLWKYTAVVRSTITYGSVIWAHTQLHKFGKLACVSDMPKGIPASPSGLTPLCLHIQIQARRAIYTMASSISEASRCLNRKNIDILSRRYRKLIIPKDNMTTRFHFDRKFELRWDNMP